ncbi:MAG: macrolide ABC transporter ATP-binding protein [Sphingobium sp.]|nr:MAG: macrolide ABC transporter ATP-binding protein [Sphingobium sp.]
MAADPIISLRGITKIFGSGPTAFQALKGIDLDIEQGDFVAVMGPSGSGKSTTMNILGCLDVPSGGQFLFKGRHVETLDRDQRALLRRRYLGFVFQGFNLLARTSALENVELPLLGQQQRVAIARAIVTQPDVLLADEPTGNLDSERSVEIMQLLTDLNQNSGITVLMVTHEPDMAEFARTIVHFKDGLVERIEKGLGGPQKGAVG